MSEWRPMVSILMPYFETGQLALGTWQSVLDQTYNNWELLLVDDGSRKDTAKDLFAGVKDSRLKILCHEKNLGIGASRNTAAAQSRGELFLPLDSDDLIAPTYIERTLEAIKQNNTDAAYCDVEIFGNETGHSTPIPDAGQILAGRFPYNTLLLKREIFEAVGGYDHIETTNDSDFWVTIIEKGCTFAYVPEPLYLYRKHSNSITTRRRYTYMVNQVKMMIKHQDSTKANIVLIYKELALILLNKGSLFELRGKQERLQAEFNHVQKEYEVLQSQFEELQQRLERNNSKLNSISGVTKQIAYLGLKKLRLR